MTDHARRPGGVGPNGRPGASAAHDAHDLALVAAHATGDTSQEAAARADELLASCAECRELAADIRGIRLAVRAMPAPARQRDFRITADQAARLRPASPWARLARALLAPRGAGRQLSGALMTLGFAGLVVTGLAVGGILPGLGTLGTATELASRDATSAAGAPNAANYGTDTQSGSTAGGSKQGTGDGASPAASPVTAALPGMAATPLPEDRGPVAPDQAPLVDGGGAAEGAAGAQPPQRASDTGGASTPVAWTPFLAALSSLALVAGLGLFLLRRRLAATR